MANNKHQLAEMTADGNRAWLANILAEEGEWSGLSVWQLGAWAIAAVGSLIVAFLAFHSPLKLQREAADDLLRESQEVQWLAKEGQSETRRLSSAVDALSADRDRLFARVTTLEQGMNSVTGSVARPSLDGSTSAASSSAQLANSSGATSGRVASSSPVNESGSQTSENTRTDGSASVEKKEAASDMFDSNETSGAKEMTQAEPAKQISVVPVMKPTQGIPPVMGLTEEKSLGKATDLATLSIPVEKSKAKAGTPGEVAVHHTEFGVDLGGATSIDGLRALWQGAVKANASVLSPLRPVIAIKERRNGLGMQLRLVAGPLNDATAATVICASLAETNRACETSMFEGQRLALKGAAEESVDARASHKRPALRRSRIEETSQPQATTSSALFGSN